MATRQLSVDLMAAEVVAGVIHVERHAQAERVPAGHLRADLARLHRAALALSRAVTALRLLSMDLLMDESA